MCRINAAQHLPPAAPPYPLRCRRPGAPKGKATQAYMRVSEAEIADDYPAPQVGGWVLPGLARRLGCRCRLAWPARETVKLLVFDDPLL